MEKYELRRRIEKIVDRNCVEFPWEGTEVNKSQIIQDVLDLIDESNRNTMERDSEVFERWGIC